MIGGLHIQQVRQMGVEVRPISCHPATATTTAMIPRMATKGVARAPSPPPPPRFARGAAAPAPAPGGGGAAAAAAAGPRRSTAAAATAAAMAGIDPAYVEAAAAYAAAVDAGLEKSEEQCTWLSSTLCYLKGQGRALARR